MRTLRNLALYGMLTAFLAPTAFPREWTSTDGRTIEAEFISATATGVTVKRKSDLRIVKIPLERLTEADQKWVTENKDKPKPARLGLDPKPADLKGNAYAEMLTGDWHLAEYRGLPYAIYGAKKLDPTKTYPLILGLHGKSTRNDNGMQTGGFGVFTKVKTYKENPAIIVAPLCYQPFGGSGGGWNKKPGTQAIDLIKDISKNLPLVDKNRVYILGYSMGGGGTAKLMTDEPKLFAAGIVVAGWVEDSAAKVFKRVPVWAFHGSDDDVVDPGSIQKMAKSLKRSKIFKYTEFEGQGHGIVGEVFKDPAVIEWLFAQKK